MKTAVEYLEEIIYGDKEFSLSEVFKQAKEMEKQQIIDAYVKGAEDWYDGFFVGVGFSAEDYYNITFKSE